MSHSKSIQTEFSSVDQAAVVAYLQQHPELLEQVHLTHDCGTATSLLERQSQMMRRRLQACDAKLASLIHTARLNDAQFERTRHLVIELCGANDLAAVIAALEDSFCNTFAADRISCMLCANYATAAAPPMVRWVDWQQAESSSDLQKQFQGMSQVHIHADLMTWLHPSFQ